MLVAVFCVVFVLVVLVVRSCVVDWVTVVVVIRVVGRAACLILLLMKSLSIAFRFELFRRGEPGRVAREIVVVSVGSVWLSVISWPVFLVSSTFFAWLILLGSSWRQAWSQRSPWCLAIILACLQ